MRKTDEQIYEIDARDYLPVFARYKIVLDHGEGVYVYDTKGKKYNTIDSEPATPQIIIILIGSCIP